MSGHVEVVYFHGRRCQMCLIWVLINNLTFNFGSNWKSVREREETTVVSTTLAPLLFYLKKERIYSQLT
jgi:hypothetical protein